MKCHFVKILWMILAFTFGNAVFAEERVPTLGEIAHKLTQGTDTITQLMLLACLIVGIGMVILSIGMYRSHRTNPKFVPLDKAVLYLILGLLLLVVPFLDRFFGLTGSTRDLKKQQIIIHHDIDAPLNPPPTHPKR